MENFNPVKERFRVHSLINEGGCEQGMDTEITLPEYFPDIVKILKCYVTPVIGSHSAEGERVSADGMITVKIVYAGEENRLYSYDTGNPFSCFCDIGSVNEESIVFPKASVQSVSCRAVSQRKFELHTTVKINFKAYKTLDTEVVTGVEGCGAEEKTALVSVKNSVKMIEKNISLVESVDIDDGKPSVSRLIKTHGAAVINEVKIIPNKMMVKGEVMAKSVYCGDESPGGFFIQPNSMPFNEIIEVQGLKETDNCDIAIRTVNIETAVKSKLNGDMRTLDHNIKMTFHINAEEVRELNCVTDAYSTEYDMNLERTAVDTVKSSENLFENFIAKGSVGMSDTAISGVSDVTCVECTKNVSVSDGCLFIRGKIYADIIYTSGDGSFGFADKALEYEYKREMTDITDKISFEPNISITAVNYSLAAGSLDLKAELIISGTVFCLAPVTVITKAEICEETKKEKRRSNLTVYYAEEGESVWEISKKYRAGAKILMEENGLQEETLSEKRALLIPCV